MRECCLGGQGSILCLCLLSHTQPVLIGSWSKISVFLALSPQPHPTLCCPHLLTALCSLLSLQANLAFLPPGRVTWTLSPVGPGAAELPTQQDVNLDEALC